MSNYVYKLRWPMRVGTTLHSALTPVKVLNADDPRVQKVWPGIQHKPDSDHYCILLPGTDQGCVVKKDQVMEVLLHECPQCRSLHEGDSLCADCLNDAQAT